MSYPTGTPANHPSGTEHVPVALASSLRESSLVRHTPFLLVIGLLIIVAAALTPFPEIARWFAFALAAYSAVANDSMQTIGTFLASNEKRPWWILWLFVAAIFIATIGYSYFNYQGDVSFERLQSKGFLTTPTDFTFLQLAAPIGLLILTRMRMPVSTTFLLLTSMATSAKSVGSVIEKSVAGYLIAFAAALAVYLVFSKVLAKHFQGKASKGWHIAQWVTSGTLWSVWIMQDAANLAVYLPRSLSLFEFFAFVGVVVVALAVIFRRRGGRMQEIVREKSSALDIRSATVIDLVYALTLFVFKEWSDLPMSTTWVFVGLLAGREIGMRWRNTSNASNKEVRKMVGRDLLAVSNGLALSLVLALAANDVFCNQVLDYGIALFAG